MQHAKNFDLLNCGITLARKQRLLDHADFGLTRLQLIVFGLVGSQRANTPRHCRPTVLSDQGKLEKGSMIRNTNARCATSMKLVLRFKNSFVNCSMDRKANRTIRPYMDISWCNSQNACSNKVPQSVKQFPFEFNEIHFHYVTQGL